MKKSFRSSCKAIFLIVLALSLLVSSAFAEVMIDPSWHRDESLKGRGMGYTSPEYVGVIGYVVTGLYDVSFEKDGCCTDGDWQVPIYEKDKQFWKVAGEVSHKTEVVVLEQELSMSIRAYSGYLLVKQLDNGAEYYIELGNYMTKPYWEQDVISAVSDGYVLAEFNQVSDYYPVFMNGGAYPMEDGTVLLLVGKSGLSRYINMYTNQLEAKRYIKVSKGWIIRDVYVNADDLTIIY